MAKNKNNGKIFETNFKESIPTDIWVYRPHDIGGGMLARFTSESICDLMAYNPKTKNFFLFELKSTVSTSMSFRPYSEYLEYKEIERDFNTWIQNNPKPKELTHEETCILKENTKNRRIELKQKKKALNAGMIKFHQIESLYNAWLNYGIQSYMVLTFYKSEATYLIHIKDFVSFWIKTTKKSINEEDVVGLTTGNCSMKLEQEYVGRSTKKVHYNVSFLNSEVNDILVENEYREVF